MRKTLNKLVGLRIIYIYVEERGGRVKSFRELYCVKYCMQEKI